MAKTLMLPCTGVNVVMGFLYKIRRRILALGILKAAYGLTELMTDRIYIGKNLRILGSKAV